MFTEGYEDQRIASCENQYKEQHEVQYKTPYENPHKETHKEPLADLPGTGTTAMLIRIFGKKDQEPYGDIIHYHLKKPVPYQGAAELVLRIDAISRSLDLPASGSTFRSVRRPRDETGNVLPGEYWQEEASGGEPGDARDMSGPQQEESAMEGISEAAPGCSGITASPPPKVRDTIYLQVFGRQHTSIQGRIWGRATRKQYVSFHSALELIYLLSEAV